MPLSDFTIGKVLGKGTFGSVCIVHRKIGNEKCKNDTINRKRKTKRIK